MNQTFALIGCSATKLAGTAPAGELYCGDLFQLCKQYCEARKIPYYILSSCYGLIETDRRIQAYDLRINQLTSSQRHHWGFGVRSKLLRLKYGEGDTCVFLAGRDYFKPLEGHFVGLKCNVVRPLAGRAIGMQKRWLKLQIEQNLTGPGQ